MGKSVKILSFVTASILSGYLCISIVAQPPKQLQINPGRLIELNKPGTILVTIDIGLDDGIRPGHKLNVVNKKKVVGTIQIVKSLPDRSTAKITDVLSESALSLGDDIQSP